MNWKPIAEWGKQRPLALRIADRLGRSRGRLRLFDRLSPAPAAPHGPNLKDWENQELAAAWLGHATVLLRLSGMTVLTDPVLFDRIGLGLGLMTGGPRRFFAPALTVRELPSIDLILISHAHFDHLDRPTLAQLPRRTPVITAANTQDLITDLGFRQVIELGWGKRTQIGPLTITAHQVNHWGARTFYDRHRGFNAYLLEGGKRRILYGGDTAYYDGFKSLPGVDLAVFGIGAYDPWIASHATPEQAWRMADQVRADYLLPMHHSTFRLSHEPMDEPLRRMMEVAGNDAPRIVASEIGMQWALN